MKTLPIRVGIIGGGQLAQMLALAAHGLGIRPVVLANKTTDCATLVVKDVFFNDGSEQSLKEFFAACDLVTVENEFIDLARFEGALGNQIAKVRPTFETLKLVQNKRDQKDFFKKSKIPTLEYHAINSSDDLKKAREALGAAIVVKQARLGYDGKGTFILKNEREYSEFESTASVQGYAEPLADFKKELAVIVVRSLDGKVSTFPTVETFQDNGICLWTRFPAGLTSKQESEAQRIARAVATKLKNVGALGVEMFLLRSGEIVVNEIAPRVHNSGHLSQDLFKVSQFEQHLRAVTGLSLVESEPMAQAGAMVNILGQKEVNLEANTSINLEKLVLEENLWIHWYGKVGPTLRRKLGHVNCLDKNEKMALKRAQKAREKILV